MSDDCADSLSDIQRNLLYMLRNSLMEEKIVKKSSLVVMLLTIVLEG